ncbi:hypothetical protein H5410_064416 [Solanum commersonii]|uniref:Uncharacterized protein n=1 Tax=Solanum commersonii TaxID=4109 RepID=A0A9J5VZQ6_SOLCO|nr:hypothetical protein H5410_064416 [Solanum commersonii]
MLERKNTRVVQFLMKLRPEFDPIRANILNRETLPNIDVVFGELISEETHIFWHSWILPAQLTRLCINQSSLFQKSGPQCFECKEYDHIELHYKKRIIWNYCKKPGHIILECNQRPNTRQIKQKAYQASVAYVSQAEITPSSLDLKALPKMIQEIHLLSGGYFQRILSICLSGKNLNKNSKTTYHDKATQTETEEEDTIEKILKAITTLCTKVDSMDNEIQKLKTNEDNLKSKASQQYDYKNAELHRSEDGKNSELKGDDGKLLKTYKDC